MEINVKELDGNTTVCYVLVDYVRGDMFTNKFETESEAIAQADWEWNRLSDSDKAKRDAFYVLESSYEDEDSIAHLDGNVVKSWIFSNEM